MTTLQRIKQYIDIEGLSIQKFEKKIGLSNGSFGSQLKNNRTIGVDKLEKILIAFPKLSAEWLLTGQGSMLKTEKKSGGDFPDSYKLLEKQLAEKDKQINELLSIIKQFKS